MKSQEQQILEYLQSGKTITIWESIQLFHCTRLSGRIYDLKKAGHNIHSEPIQGENGKRFSKYWLEKTVISPSPAQDRADLGVNSLNLPDKVGFAPSFPLEDPKTNPGPVDAKFRLSGNQLIFI